MSSCIFTWTYVGFDPAAPASLHAQLEAAISSPFDAWAAPLQTIFGLWEQPFVLRVSWIGSVLRCVIDTSAHDEMEKEQLQALHAAGVEYLRVRVFNSQVGESAVLGAIACLVCGRGSALRPLCLPLVELLLSHGAWPHGAVERVTGPWQGGFDDVGVEGDWTQVAGDFQDTGTVLERLLQRQAQAPDPIDAAVIAALSACA